jgi:DNA-binding protein H-NS
MARLGLKTIERRIKALQATAERLKRKQKKPAIGAILALMRKHDLSVADIRGAVSGRGGRRKSASLRGRKVKPMYRNPKTGETWSGRGRTARWLAALEKAGHKRSAYLIKK